MRLACLQSNVVLGDQVANGYAAARQLEALSEVDVAVFPEAFLTGYCESEFIRASAIAISRADKSIRLLEEASQDLNIVTVVGFAERTDEGLLHNTAALFERDRPTRFYRKTHIPELGLDKCVTPGKELPVFETSHGRIGILICFDLRHPEPSRVLALRGADVIVLPTNWPEGAEVSAEHMGIARAAENRVFVACCNRVGEENGFRFIGHSKIIGPSGEVLAAAGHSEEVILAEINVKEARQKRRVMIPGVYETTAFESRRPELYGDIVLPIQ